MKLFKITLVSLCLLLFSSLAYSDTQFYLFGKGNFIGSSGTEFEYEPGVNDFPFVSSHQNFGAGFGLTSGKIVFVGIEGHYNMSGKITLTDPSDDDTLEVNTYKYVSGFVTLGFNILNSRFMRLYINGGGGVNYYLDASGTKRYFSRLGIETDVVPPEKKYSLAGFGGIGFEFYFSQSGGIMLSGRYLYISLEEPQTIFIAMAGLVFRF